MAKAENTRQKSKTSFTVFDDTYKKMKYISLVDEKNIVDLVDEAFNDMIAKYEKKNGPIPVK